MKKLNLGSGEAYKLYPDYEGLDIVDFGQTYVGDVLELITSPIKYLDFEDNYWDEVMANHFLEHFDQNNLQTIFFNTHRMLIPGGAFKFVVPHMKKEKSWVLSHKTFWNEETVKWLEREDADLVYGFGKWKILELVTNEREDIHIKLEAIK